MTGISIDESAEAIAAHMGVDVETAERWKRQALAEARKIARAPAITAAQERVRDYYSDRTRPGRADSVPVGERGLWKIDRVTVTPEQESIERIRSVVSSSSRGRWVPAGDYTWLRRRDPESSWEPWVTVMSDTPDELMDHVPFANAVEFVRAKRVLINGLGLGCAVRMALAASPEIERIDVVEFSPDVIALVAPSLDERVVVHEGDAYTFRWPPNTRWDVAWHDIWDYISGDNDFATLHRRYGRRVRWQGSWCRAEAERRW